MSPKGRLASRHYEIAQPARSLRMLHLQTAFAQPLTLLLVSVIRLNVVLRLRIPHVAIDQHTWIKHEQIVRESAMSVEQRMRLDVDIPLREDPLLQLHPIRILDLPCKVHTGG